MKATNDLSSTSAISSERLAEHSEIQMMMLICSGGGYGSTSQADTQMVDQAYQEYMAKRGAYTEKHGQVFFG